MRTRLDSVLEHAFDEGMRWEAQRVDARLGQPEQPALPGMPPLPGYQRSVRTPEFAGVTFHEVHAKSALNKVPGGGQLPFGWTVNPYRGCTHGCVYCFARRTHTYLDFDVGRDFDTQVVVKTNVAQVLRAELARPSWRHEQVALGTNTDPYQRAEGRYRLMPGIIDALASSGTPLSVLTKGTLLARDLTLLAEAAQQVPVGIGISLALLDPALQHAIEPGTPGPRARLGLITKVRAAGLPCGVLVAPVLPLLTDSEHQLRALFAELAAAGATSVTGFALHLRPGAREWFFAWLERERPDLLPAYRRLYAGGANATAQYRRRLGERIRRIRAECGLAEHDGTRFDTPTGPGAGTPGARPERAAPSTDAEQPTLLEVPSTADPRRVGPVG